MLRIILNRLNPIAENILEEEKAGFRKKRSTIEQILNCRILAEKHIEHGKKYTITLLTSISYIWHERLWKVMRHFNIDENSIAIIENLYKKNKQCRFVQQQNKDLL